MVPGENEHEPGVDFVDEIEIAIDGVGGTAIAAVRRARVGGPWNDDGAAQRTIPSSGEMREQRRRLVETSRCRCPFVWSFGTVERVGFE
jgi:hypothetical protein